MKRYYIVKQGNRSNNIVGYRNNALFPGIFTRNREMWSMYDLGPACWIVNHLLQASTAHIALVDNINGTKQ